MTNLEIKAACPDIESAANIALALGATLEWVHEQQDTYFQVNTGKLKLREVAGQPAELIFYQRTQEPDIKTSNYHIYRSNEPAQLVHILTCFMNKELVVKKIRTLYLWHNVRIHLDKVEQLGNFIEFEAVISDKNDLTISEQRVNHLLKEFAINPGASQAAGYYELIRAL